MIDEWKFEIFMDQFVYIYDPIYDPFKSGLEIFMGSHIKNMIIIWRLIHWIYGIGSPIKDVEVCLLGRVWFSFLGFVSP